MTEPKKPAPRKKAVAAKEPITAKPVAKPAAKTRAAAKSETGNVSTAPANKPAAKKASAKAAKPKKPAAPTQVEGVDPDAMSAEESLIHERFSRAVEIVNAADLAPRIKIFVIEYAKDLNATNAAIRAGYAKKSAHVEGSRLLSNAKVKQTVDAIMNDRVEQGIFDGDAIVARWMDISTANPNALTQYRRVNCRYCWGDGFNWQFTPKEFEQYKADHARAVLKALKDGDEPPIFDPKGGVGFWGTKDPHPECPECFGEGEGVPFFTDSRKLDRQSLALYAGVKQTKEGLEIQMHDQAAATDKLARYFGLYRDKLAEAIEANITPELLEERFAAATAKARAKQAQIEEERKALANNGKEEETDT